MTKPRVGIIRGRGKSSIIKIDSPIFPGKKQNLRYKDNIPGVLSIQRQEMGE